MLKLLKSFVKEEDGLTTVEIVLILAVLVGLALIFRKAIFAFVTKIINSIFKSSEPVIEQPEIDVDPNNGINGVPG